MVFLYKLIRGEEVTWETETHRKYGEVVRIGPDRLSYVTPQAWKDIAGPGMGKCLDNSKDKSTFGPDLYGMRTLSSQFDTLEHRSQRRVFAPAFSDRALKMQEPLILDYLNPLLRIIKNYAASNPIVRFDMVRLLNCMTFNVMADLTFGEPLGLLDQPKLTSWVQAVFDNVQEMSIARVAREYPLLARLIKVFNSKTIIEGARLHYEQSYTLVERRLERGINIGKPDIWRLAMEKSDGLSRLQKRQMTTHAQAFMMAGTETTATLPSGLIFLLLKHAHYMQRLQKEVLVLKKEELSPDKLAHLPSVNACIQEALRCYPPAPITFFRTTPKGCNMVCGEWILESVSTSCSVSERKIANSAVAADPHCHTPFRCLSLSFELQEFRVFYSRALVTWIGL